MIGRAARVTRATVRGLGLVALTAGTFAVVWPAGHVATLPSARLSWGWRSWCFRWWSRAALRLLSVEVVRIGERPSPPFVLAANHLSYLDVVVLASELDAAFVAKSEVASWPVLGLLCRCMGTLFVDRRRQRDISRVLGEIESHLEAGHGVVLFPEGTSTDGGGVDRFRSPLLQAATDGRIGASFAALAYTTPPGSPPARLSVCWWGDMLFFPHLLGLLALPSLEARLRFGEAPIHSTDRKALAARLQSEVSRLVPPRAPRFGWEPGDDSPDDTQSARRSDAVPRREHMNRMVIEQNLFFLRQGSELVRGLDRETFAGRSGSAPGSAVGPHVRHCIDFYRALLDGLAGGQIDYDARDRDPSLESDPRAAAEALDDVAERLAGVSDELLTRSLLVRSDVAPGEDPEAAWAASSVARELRGLVSHTVHHYALVALLLRQRGVEPEHDFGVAPATLEHWRRSRRDDALSLVAAAEPGTA